MNISTSVKSAILCFGILFLAPVIIAAVISVVENHRTYDATTVSQDTTLVCPPDMDVEACGVKFRMIGVQGGSIRCKGMNKELEVKSFCIGETEVTRELWAAVMGSSPSCVGEDLSMPVESVSLLDCLEFVQRLDSVTGLKFSVPEYECWLYAAKVGEDGNPGTLNDRAWYEGNSQGKVHPVKTKAPNGIGLYDMEGNVAEWTLSGSDPLFFAAGGSYDSMAERCHADSHGVNHAEIQMSTLGLRLVYVP